MIRRCVAWSTGIICLSTLGLLAAPLVYMTPDAPPWSYTVAPKTETDPDKLTEQATTEAAEVTADIEETKGEIQEAKAAGDTDRAERLEKRVESLETKLDGIASTLTKLADRPFHPAPEPEPKTEGDTNTPPPAAETTTTDDDTPPAKTSRNGWFGKRWNPED